MYSIFSLDYDHIDTLYFFLRKLIAFPTISTGCSGLAALYFNTSFVTFHMDFCILFFWEGVSNIDNFTLDTPQTHNKWSCTNQCTLKQVSIFVVSSTNFQDFFTANAVVNWMNPYHNSWLRLTPIHNITHKNLHKNHPIQYFITMFLCHTPAHLRIYAKYPTHISPPLIRSRLQNNLFIGAGGLIWSPVSRGLMWDYPMRNVILSPSVWDSV